MNLLNNVLASLFPTIVYLIVIWFTLPKNSISLRKMGLYLGAGSLSVILLMIIHMIFPSIVRPSFNEILGIQESSSYLLNKAFNKVSLLEEGSKFTVFIFIYCIVQKNKLKQLSKDITKPLGILVCGAMIGLAFGTIENILYCNRFGVNVLLIRSVTALLLHTLLGLIMGYSFAWAKITHKNKNKNNSLYSRLCKSSILYNYATKLSVAFFICYLIHGVYDFNLFLYTSSSISIMITQLIITIMISHLMINNIIRKQNEEQKGD